LSTSETAIGPRPGLSNVTDIVVAPNAAFDRLRLIPTWGWALLAGSVLAMIGSLLIQSATLHALQISLPAKLAASPAMAKLSPEQQQSYIAASLNFAKVLTQISFIFPPIFIMVAGVVQALIMTIANAASHGDGGFKKYFALSVTVSVIGLGLFSLVNGVIVLVRGAGSFESTTAVQSTVPGLALLAPGARGALEGFLGALNVFYLWGTALLALGMQRVGRISPPVAWITAIVMLLLTACFAAWGGAQNG
jgi:hypothetical protein